MDDRYLCPQCGSDDVRKLEMIWKEQTGDINLDSVGTTYGTGGVNVGFFLGALFGLVGIWSGHKDLATVLFWTMMGAGGMYGCFLGGKDHVWNENVWPKVYSGWQHTWMCTRCGKRFSVHD